MSGKCLPFEILDITLYVLTCNRNDEFILCEERWLISNAKKWKLGWNLCAEALLNGITSAKVLLNLKKTTSNSSAGHEFSNSSYSFNLNYLI